MLNIYVELIQQIRENTYLWLNSQDLESMNIRFLLLFFLLFSGLVPNNSLFSQNSFELTFATPNHEEILDGILHTSGNVYLVGRKFSFETMNYHTLILKVNGEGQMDAVEWQYQDTIGFFPQLLELDNNNIMLIGQCSAYPGNESNVRWLRIVDPQLNVISDHFFFQDTSYMSVYQNNTIIDYEGNIVVLGVVEFNRSAPGLTTTDFFLSKYSQDGDSLNFKIYDFPDHPESVFDLGIIPETNEYLAVTSAFFIGMPYPQIVRISHDFELINNVWFQASELQNPCSLGNWTNSSTFIFSSLSVDYEDNDDQVGIYKTDTIANIIKSIDLGKNDTIDYPSWYNNIIYIDDTTIYVGGFINFPGLWTTEPSYVELYLIDTNLNLLGYRQFGGDINYQLFGIIATADNGCLLYTSSYSDSNFNERDVCIFKVPRDSVEIITQIHDLPGYPQKEISAYPNPASDIINIPLDSYYQDVNIQLYKVEGKKVYDATTTGSGNLISIKVNHLPTGIYIYKLTSSGQIFRAGKFVKL